MSWYLWQRGRYVPDYSIGENESFIQLRAKTLQEAKEELGLIIIEENIIDDWRDIDLVATFGARDSGIAEAKLFYVEQEIDLESDIVAAQKKKQEFRAKHVAEKEKEARYQEYLKLQAEFQK